MKAVIVNDFRAEPELTELPTPELGPGEVLVRVHAAGLNPFDWQVADGALKDVVPHSFPLVLGSDGAGLVVKLGPGVTRYREGDRVYGQFMQLPQGQGSYSEFTLAHQDGKLTADVAEYLRELGAHTVIDAGDPQRARPAGGERGAAGADRADGAATRGARGSCERTGRSRARKDRDPALRDITREVG